jgi:threonylcarbamoyladenosine tRNA methylthiotransferase MtaB
VVETYRIVALGCKVSQADAASIDRQLRASGARPAEDGQAASVCVVCGCAVTGVAEGKSRRSLGRMRRENPGATVVAAGCLAARMGERTASPEGGASGPAADALVPPSRVADFVGAVGRRAGRAPSTGEGTNGFPGRTRAIVKV